MHCGTGAGVTSTISNCLFENNQAAGGANNLGGALRSQAAGTLTVEKCIFRNNDAVANGSAVHIQLALATNFTTLSNCLIYGNTTKGAVYMLGGTMNNCTVVNNPEGGIYLASATIASKIYNSVIWGNDTKSGGITSVASNSVAIVQNTAYTSIQSANITGSNNTDNKLLSLTNDGTTLGTNYPRFTDPANNIYTLNTNSDLLESGQTIVSVTTDILGVTRYQGSSYDIGAYEAIQSSVNASGLTLNTYSDISILNGGALTFDANKNINSISIGSGGKVSLNSGNSLTAAKASIFSDAINGTGTFVDNNPTGGLTVTGTTSVQQYLSGGGRAWWYLSSPLAAASSSIFGSDKVGKHVEDYESDGNPATTAPYYSSPFSTPETLTPGYGYILKRTSPADNATYTFTGSALNSGTISPTVTRTGTTAGARGFNLVGNPYPSYIDWDAVYADATHLRNALWFRTYSGGQMVFHTYGDGDAVPEITSSTIAPMQAFWVKVDADGNTGTLTFKNTHRSHFTSGANPLKVTANDNRQRIRLVISNGTANDETLLVGKSYAQDNRDNYDIEKMSNENSEIPEIFSIVGNEELVINAMQAINEGKTFSLGIRPGQAGSYTIKATQLENISGHVVLVDRLTGTETELTESSSYSFNSDGTATNDRFSVEVRAPGALTSTETTSIKKLRIDRLNNCILIRGTKAGEQVGIFNTMGQLLQSFTASGDRTELQHTFSPGIYLIKANQQSGKFTLK